MPKRIDLSGREFYRLTAIHREYRGREAWWNCLCKCGQTKWIRQSHLVQSMVRSCGCMRYVWVAEKLRTRYIKHGLSKTRMYNTWKAMKDRCLNPDHKIYRHYGGRGIKVCERWMSSFENFLSDMGYKPTRCVLDRIDNDGDYEPGNCRWSTPKESATNRRTTHWIMVDGVKMSMSEAARVRGMRPGTLSERLRKGIPDQVALSTPVQRYRHASV